MKNKSSLDEEKNKDLPIKADKKNIITYKNGMKILLPAGYQNARLPIDISKLIYRFNSAIKNEHILEKAVETSWNKVLISRISKKEALDYNNKEELIKRIESSIGADSDDAIIEVENGKTIEGYKYIFFIIKKAKPEGMLEYKLSYYLTLHLFYKNEIVQVKGLFEETNMTGAREALASVLAEKCGIVTITDSGLEGWFEPFNEEKNSKINRNVGERRGFDALVPYNPLSQARELLLSIIEHKYVIEPKEIFDEIEDDNDNDNDNGKENSKTKESHINEQEEAIMNKVFSKDYTRRTRDVIL